jgi:hypothetical protein
VLPYKKKRGYMVCTGNYVATNTREQKRAARSSAENRLTVAALGIRRVVEAYSKGGVLTNDQPEAQRKLLSTAYVARPA